ASRGLGGSAAVGPAPCGRGWSKRSAAGTGGGRRIPRGPPPELLARHGQMPLPPYIRKGRAEAGDAERYQTVFASRPGAIAAPTAGLHFTPAVFDDLAERGVATTRLTLHVGVGTFQPIRVEDHRQHVMHHEWGELSAAAAAAINACRAAGGRVVARRTTPRPPAATAA